MRRLALVPTAFAVLLAGSATAQGASIDETIVYVECKTPNQIPRKGSGVMISSDGALLTAKHVAFGEADTLPVGTQCEGVIADAGLAMSKLTFRKHSDDYDAVVLSMPAPPGSSFKAVRYCPLGPDLLRAAIFATGFPLEDEEQPELRQTRPSSRAGVLATVQPNGLGLIETDSQTTQGMSGGMVTLGLSSTLIGIVAGVDTDTNGLPKTYRILAAEVLADEFGSFGLTEAAAERCPPSLLTGEISWSSGSDPKLLGLMEGEGFCFITRIFGKFDASNDMVQVELHPSEGYRLTGDNGGEKLHGGAARCVRH